MNKRIELIQAILNLKRMTDEQKESTIKSFLLGWITEEQMQEILDNCK
jgi:hypothetical protein